MCDVLPCEKAKGESSKKRKGESSSLMRQALPATDILLWSALGGRIYVSLAMKVYGIWFTVYFLRLADRCDWICDISRQLQFLVVRKW